MAYFFRNVALRYWSFRLVTLSAQVICEQMVSSQIVFRYQARACLFQVGARVGGKVLLTCIVRFRINQPNLFWNSVYGAGV